VTTLRRYGLYAFFGKDGEGGQMIVLVAMMVLTLLFFVGLSVDVGQLYFSKRAQQEAVDAAAFAGAIVRYQGGSVAQAVTAARTDAITNGFDGACGGPSYLATTGACTSAATNTTVTVNLPPPAGALYAGDNNYLQVIIVRQVRTSLVPAESVLNPVTASSIAGAHGYGFTLFALQTLATSGTCINLTSSGGVNVINFGGYGGPVSANCSGTSAISHGGSGVVTDSNAGGINTVGTNAAGCCSGIVNTGVPPAPDPFAGFPKPVASGANQTKTCGTNLPPGHYSDLNTTSCDWNLTGGVYILRGGGITLSGAYNINEASGNTGTMIFLTTGNYDSGGGGTGCGTITLPSTSSGSISMHAGATWPDAGMAIYFDPACGAQTVTVAGTGGIAAIGSFYGANVTFNLSSSATMTCYCQFVVSRVNITGSGGFWMSVQQSQTASPVLPALVQ
jgi:Flp pilus assembly protein TadG